MVLAEHYPQRSYITGALKADLNLGKYSGPLNHCWNLMK
jgi:hypothetical protein